MSARRYNVGLLVRRSLRQHAVSTGIAATSLALACGLVMALFNVQAQSESAFVVESSRFDAVLGARGSQLQLVLNAVFHLETSPGNLPWSTVEQMRATGGVRAAIPYAVGDSWRGFRVVGTQASLFESERALAAGRVFDEELREAVVGSYVAAHANLRVGDRIQPSHGIGEHGHEHDESYVVVGVLEATNTPDDRVVWIPIEGMWRMGGHVLRGDGDEYEADPEHDIPDVSKEVSAVLLAFASPQVGVELDRAINKEGRDATLAWPIGRVVAELFDKLGWMSRVLTLVAYLTVLVATAAILASLYDAMHARRREHAILRALGASRRLLFSSIVLESAAISALGALGGFAVYAAFTTLARATIRAQTGVVLDPLQFHPALLITPAAVIVLGALAGCVPAWKAYRVEVAEGLSPTS